LKKFGTQNWENEKAAHLLKGNRPAFTKKHGKNKVPVSKTKEVKPDRVIPMEEGDFTE
jgi:hypothetical protein